MDFKNMNKKYFSVDVETSGRIPGKYSMLSLGACVVGETSIQFYRELKPISTEFLPEAMKVSVLGLRCLEKLRTSEEFDPNSSSFNPAKVLAILDEHGERPQQVMADFASWILQNSRGYKPVEAAAPIKFDGMFTAWYFNQFYPGENPFGHNGEDINSLYRGATGNPKDHISQLRIRGDNLPHNALEDAILQAREMEEVLRLMRSREAW